jgi:L-rhamnose-H+ transport protein
MNMTSSELGLGIAFAILSGIMGGTYTLPMRYLGRWSWENVWALFIVVSFIVMPVVICCLTVPGLAQVLREAPVRAIAAALVTGFAWGFGAIMFGQGISAIGISMGNTLVLAISSPLGSFLPILILAPERLFLPQGKAIMLGSLIGMVGIVSCGYAGLLRERSQRDQVDAGRGGMVGKARPYWAGLLLCIGAGLLSAVFNIGYSFAQGLLQTATRLGYSAFAGSNLEWLLILGAGAVPNLLFCGYLFKKNCSWVKYTEADTASLYALSVFMGLLWACGIFMYGFAAPKLGKLGPAIGWPLSVITGIATANICGFATGEWKFVPQRARSWMLSGLAVLIIAVGLLGWSGSLAR